MNVNTVLSSTCKGVRSILQYLGHSSALFRLAISARIAIGEGVTEFVPGKVSRVVRKQPTLVVERL